MLWRFFVWRVHMIKKVMARYSSHLYIEPDGPTWIYYCARCDADLSHDGSAFDEPCLSEKKLMQECVIHGEYSDDGKVLESVCAENDWLKNHWAELSVKFGECGSDYPIRV
jgi:hypothetical protein